MKILAILGLMAISSLATAVQPLAAQTKFGLVDFQTAMLSTKDMQAEATKLEVEFKPQQDALSKLSDEMQDLQQRMVSATDAQQQAQLQAQGTAMQTRFERMRQDMQSAIDFRREGILQKGAARMRAVLEKLRVEKGLDAVIDTSSIYVYNPSMELTAEATAAYDVAHPVAGN
ncbi:MAG: OmpH family outer membrane protein [Acidobacteria bacterium]|nr:OmpH family outer membrane protein [Acidobacteriota bacterium]